MFADGELTVLTRAHWYCLLAATVVAACLRLYAVGEWSLWIDEAHTWRDATMPLADFLASEQRKYYPLTFLLLRGLVALGLGQSEGALRLPFALLGIATVPLLGVCGRRLVGAWPAVLAAGLLAVDPWHVYWSQNARGYVVVVLFAVVTADRIFAYVRQQRWRDLLVAWAAIAVATLSHPTGALLAVGFVAFLMLRARPLTWRRVLILLVLAGLAMYGFWWLLKSGYLFKGFTHSKAITAAADGELVPPSLLHFVQTTGFYFRPVVLLVAAVGLWQLGHFAGRDRVLLLGSLSAVTFGMLAVVGTTVVLVTARYAISVLPIVTWLSAFAAVHVAHALSRARSLARVPRLAAVMALPLLLVGEHAWSLVDYYTIQHGQRARWREAGDFLIERAAGRPIRVATINQPTMYYYLLPGKWMNRVPPAFARNRVVPLEQWMVAEGKDEDQVKVCEPGEVGHLERHRREARKQNALFAFVVTMPELVEHDPSGRLRALITAQCHLVLHLPCWVGPKDESISVYEFNQP